MATATASDLYDQLRDARDVLEQLHAGGRLAVSTDPSNTRWTDADDAARVALAGLDTAIAALAWLDTRPA